MSRVSCRLLLGLSITLSSRSALASSTTVQPPNHDTPLQGLMCHVNEELAGTSSAAMLTGGTQDLTISDYTGCEEPVTSTSSTGMLVSGMQDPAVFDYTGYLYAFLLETHGNVL